MLRLNALLLCPELLLLYLGLVLLRLRLVLVLVLVPRAVRRPLLLLRVVCQPLLPILLLEVLLLREVCRPLHRCLHATVALKGVVPVTVTVANVCTCMLLSHGEKALLLLPRVRPGLNPERLSFGKTFFPLGKNKPIALATLAASDCLLLILLYKQHTQRDSR